MELFSPSLKLFPEKNFLYFFKKKSPPWNFFEYFLKQMFFLSFRKWEVLAPTLKKLLIFQEGTFQAQKMRMSTWKHFLHFRKWNFLAPILRKFIVKKLLYVIFFIRIFFNRVWSIRIIIRSFYGVSNKLKHIFFFSNIFPFF